MTDQQLQIRQHVESYTQEFSERNTQKLSVQREIGYAVQILTDPKNKFLATTAKDNKQSLRNAVLNVADLGVTLSPALKLAYLVPMDKAVNLVISYRGLTQMAIEDGGVSVVQASLVHEKDSFTPNGMFEKPTHNFNPFSDRGQVIGVYCIAMMKDGTCLPEFMSKKDCLKIRDRSKMWMSKQSGPWATDEGEMMKKTVIKRASKLWPSTGERFAKMVDHIDSTEGYTENFEEVENKKKADNFKSGVDEKKSVIKRILEGLNALSRDMAPSEAMALMKELTNLSDVKSLGGVHIDGLNVIETNIMDRIKNV